MANEIQIDGATTGITAYAVIRNAAGQVWRTDTLVFEAYNSANWANYALLLTEQTSSGTFYGDFPTSAAAGKYSISAKQRVGATASLYDPALSSGSMEWDGTQEVTVQSRLASSGYTAPNNSGIATAASAAASAASNAAAAVEKLPVSTGDLLASADYTAPDNTGISNAASAAADAVTGITAVQESLDAIPIPGGTGNLGVTIRTGVAEARVTLVQTDGIQNEPNTADGSGDAPFRVNIGHFDIYANASGYSSYSSPTPVYINADELEFTIEMEQNVIPQPGDPNQATVGFFPQAQGVPLAGIRVTYKLAFVGPLDIDGYLESYLTSEGISGTSGDGLNDGGAYDARTKLYPESVLIAAGVPENRAYYLVSGSHILGMDAVKDVKMYVPDNGGNIATLIKDTRTRLSEA